MAVEEIGTLGRMEAGGFPYSNLQSLSFTVDATGGDVLSMSFDDPLNRIKAIVPKDGESVSGSTISYTYKISGTYTARLIVQPDFEQVTRLRIGNSPIDLSTLDFTKLTDLLQLDFYNVEKTLAGTNYQTLDRNKPFGKVQAWPASIEEIYGAQVRNVDFNFDAFPDTLRVFDQYFTPTTGDLANAPSEARYLTLRGSSVGGDASGLGSNLIYLGLGKSGTNFQGADLNPSSGTLEKFHTSGVRNFADILENTSQLKKVIGRISGDIYGTMPAGSVNENAPYLRSPFRSFVGNTNQNYFDCKLTGAPNDFSAVSSTLNFLWLEKVYGVGYNSTEVVYDKGKTHTEMIEDPNGLYAEKANFDNDPTIRCLCVTTRDPNVYTSTFEQSALHKIQGTGPQHPSNGGDGGLWESGVTVSHPAEWKFNLVAVGTDTITISGDVRYLNVQTGQGKTDWTDTYERFRVGGLTGSAQVRIDSSDGSTRKGLYEITGVSIDGNGDTVLTLDETPGNANTLADNNVITDDVVRGTTFMPLVKDILNQ